MRNSSDTPRSLRTKRIVRNIVFSLVVFIVFIAALEVVLRTTHIFGAKISYTEPDPVLSWRFTPGKRYWHYKENDHPITGTINSFGWRDKEWSIEKPQNTYRIPVVGDSYVAAFQVEPESTFLALVERELNDQYDPKVELMNFGRPGFTQTEELLVLKNEVTQFSPDMVLLFFVTGNDIQDVSRETAPDRMRPFFDISEEGQLILDTSFAKSCEFRVKSIINWSKQHSALISLLTERYNVRQRRGQLRASGRSITGGTSTLPKRIPGPLSLCTANPDTSYLRSYQLNKRLIKAMGEYCEERQILFMLVTVDNKAYLPEFEKRYKSIDPSFNANFFEDDLEDYAKQLGIEYLGLQRIFRRSYEQRGIPLHWGHWNYEGHRVVAEALASKIKAIVF